MFMISTPPKAMAKLYRSRAGRMAWWIWLVIFSICLVVLAFMVLVFGRISGIEISNQDLTAREFYYWQIPVARIQVSPVYRQLLTSSTSETEIANLLKPLKPGVTPQWDLVQFNDAFVKDGGSRSDGAILWEYIQLGQDANFFWVEWTKKHPTRAKELWPAIQDLASSHLYSGMPKLFELYRYGDSDYSLIPERDEAITDLAKFYIEDYLARKDLESAKKIATMAYPYDTHGLLKSFDKLLDSDNTLSPAVTSPAAEKTQIADPKETENK
ncbi:MAG: hypothetical protein RLY14_1590 [Planctomycetota bacterium]|jgi:hypothetical protein